MTQVATIENEYPFDFSRISKSSAATEQLLPEQYKPCELKANKLNNLFIHHVCYHASAQRGWLLRSIERNQLVGAIICDSISFSTAGTAHAFVTDLLNTYSIALPNDSASVIYEAPWVPGNELLSRSSTNAYPDIEDDSSRVAELISDLVEKGDVEEARRQLNLSSVPNVPLGPVLKHWARVLAPPIIKEKDKGTGTDRSKGLQMLRENSDQYSGQWVAIKNDEIVGHNKSKLDLYQELKEKAMISGSLFIFAD